MTDSADPARRPPPYATDRASLERESELQFVRGSGPGGQHRNKTESGVRLHHLPSGVVVTATERRSQGQNRELAYERLKERLVKLNHVPKTRKPTKPTRSSVRRRLQDKQRHGERKRDRRPPRED